MTAGNTVNEIDPSSAPNGGYLESFVYRAW